MERPASAEIERLRLAELTAWVRWHQSGYAMGPYYGRRHRQALERLKEAEMREEREE